MKFLILFLIIFVSCGKTTTKKENSFTSSFTSYNRAQNYFQSSQKLVVNVFYEPGAEPFIGYPALSVFYWKILEDNLNSIMQYRTSKPVVIVPKLLSDMKSMPSQKKSIWSIDDVIDLYSTQSSNKSSAAEAHFYVFFVKGLADTGASTIAFNITNSPVLVVFKDVIASTGTNIVQVYVEQTTVVHELGHALGFVNNGLPMKNPHQDAAHGNHTTNANCVMYWLNEGTQGLTTFVQHFISTGNTVLWGPEVLADAQAFSK
jgi:hypothetical protein